MTFDLNFCPMSDHHIDQVTSIEAQTSATPWSADLFIKEINSPTHILIVAVENTTLKNKISKVVGFTGGQVVGDELHIHSLAVLESYRRNGVGRNLILNLLNAGKERDVKTATLEVRIGNAGAIDLYEKLGFISEGIRPKYYADNGEDANIMWLRSLDGTAR